MLHADVVTVTLNPAIDRTVTVPNFTAGRVNRVERESDQPGGKGVNVASALRDYGCSVAVTGFLGRDNFSIFEEMFARKGIDDHFVKISGRTRTGIKVVDPIRRETTDINFPGTAPNADDIDQFWAVLGTLAVDEPRWFVLSGSVPPGLPATIYRDIICFLKQRGQKTLLDTSGEPLRQAVTAAPEIVKPNLDELEALVGRKLETQSAILKAGREVLDSGANLLVVSLGEQGAIFITRNVSLHAVPPSVQVGSTVGAGDAMVAGILTSIPGFVAGDARRLTCYRKSESPHVDYDNLPEAAALSRCARVSTAFSLELLTRPLGAGMRPDSIQEWETRVQTKVL